MTQHRRLDALLPTQLKHDLEQQALRSQGTQTVLVERYIREGLARDKGEVLEQQSLPIIRELVRSELQRALAQLQSALQEELQQSVLETMKLIGRRSDDRLASLLVRILRETGISRRMLYALFLRLADEETTVLTYQQARAETGKDLARAASVQEGEG